MNATRPRATTVMRRIAQFVAALAVVAGLGVVTAGTATAANVGEWACNYNAYSNTCLFITNLGSHRYAVHVGIDVHMTQQDAQNIVNSGYQPTSTLWGKDGGLDADDYKANIPISYVTAWSGGLSAEFDTTVNQSLLNEDNGPNEVDEIIAQVGIYIPAAQRTFVYQSGEVDSAF
jgi:hypothetical protein